MAKGFDLPECYLNHGQNVNSSLRNHIVGEERTGSRFLPSAVDHDPGARTNLHPDSASYFLDGDKINLIGAQYENGLFSSSLSDLFSRKLKLSSNNAYGHSVGVSASYYEEEAVCESLEELEAQTIGNLLPDNDDLLAGVTDGFDRITQPNNSEDMEDLDLFSSVGGLELGEESSQRSSEFSDVNLNNQLVISGVSNCGEHPSKTLFVRNINSNVEDSELRTLFEQYGDICTLYTACKHQGFVMISYYDIRASSNAVKALQSKPLMCSKLDIHFSIPKGNQSEKNINQGTLVVLNLDSSVSDDELREIFGIYGEIKEIREIPYGSNHKFIEFYDVRAAESALRASNRGDITGKPIKLKPGRSGVSKRSSLLQLSSELEQEKSVFQPQQPSPPNNLAAGFSDNGTTLGPRSTNGNPIDSLFNMVLHTGAPSSVPNTLPSLVRLESGNQSSNTECGPLWNPQKLDRRWTLHPHSLPDHDGSTSVPPFGSSSDMAARPIEVIDNQKFRKVNSTGQIIVLNEAFGSSGNGSCPPPGHHYLWRNAHHPQPQAIVWPNSSSFVKGIGAHPQQVHAVSRAPSHMLNALLSLKNHHVGSAPSVNSSLWDRRHAYSGESPDTNVFPPDSFGNIRMPGNSPHPFRFVSPNIFPRAVGNCMDMLIPPKGVGMHLQHQRCLVFPARGQMIPTTISVDSRNERTRRRRNEGRSSQADNKKHFELEIDRIVRAEDKRTTLMIKNIPNKYTSKMLLTAIDECHRGTHDFIYLPIDFKNKCNVGYAFINMTDPSLIIPFYQGKAALIAHFQNSNLINEDKRCRPILFHTDGLNVGDQVPFPMGTNIRSRAGKVRASGSDDNNQENHRSSLNGEDYSNGVSPSALGKD